MYVRMRSLGSSHYLKSKFGAGYKLIFDLASTGFDEKKKEELTLFVQTHIPSATMYVLTFYCEINEI